MKIEVSVLKSFINKVAMEGISSISDCVLDFNSSGLLIRAVSAANTVMVNGVLEKSAFVDYKELGKLGIENLAKLSKYLSRFDGTVKIAVKENLLVITGNKKRVEVLLKDTDYVEQPPEYPRDIEKNYKGSIELEASAVKAFLDDVGIIGGTELDLIVKNKKLTVKSKNMDLIEEEVEVVNISSDDLVVSLGVPFITAVKNLDGKVTLEMAENYPVLVKDCGDNYEVKILVAPIKEG